MTVGYSPEVIHSAYRIGDSTTNIITLMTSFACPYFAFAMRYDKNLGIGTLISMMIPYWMAYLVGFRMIPSHVVFAFACQSAPERLLPILKLSTIPSQLTYTYRFPTDIERPCQINYSQVA